MYNLENRSRGNGSSWDNPPVATEPEEYQVERVERAAGEGTGFGGSIGVAQDVMPGGHPIVMLRDVAREVYQKFEELFSELMTREPAGFGFRAYEPPAIRVEPLAKSCERAIQVCTLVVFGTGMSGIEKAAREFAITLKPFFQSVYCGLSENSFRNGVSEAALGILAQRCIEAQQFLGEPLGQLNSICKGAITISARPENGEG